jgi:hypothetical protein
VFFRIGEQIVRDVDIVAVVDLKEGKFDGFV